MAGLDRDIEDKLLANDQALGLPAGFTKAQFGIESNFQPDAISRRGARGWAQIMPTTQAALEQRMGRKFDPTNIDDALTMHRTVMGENLAKFGNLPDALMAYNSGWDRSKWSNRETSAYPYKVLGQLGGGTMNDTRPPGLAAAYKNGGLMPASYSDDSDIFADMPRAKPQRPQAMAGRSALADVADDSDIFADLPKSKPAVPAQAAAQVSKRADPSLVERMAALPAGVNKGLTLLAGMPTDAMANVIDLGKAGIGYVTGKITGEPPPDWTIPMDRSKTVGTSDWIARKLGEGAAAMRMQSPVANPRPDDALSRVLYTGGVFAGSSVNPNPQARISGARQLANAAGGLVGGLASGTVGEVAPEWAGLAGMLPQAAASAAGAATKRVVRGNEAGRQEMAQRIQDLKNGGIEEPSVGLASGNPLVMGAENLLSLTPGSVGLYQRAKDKNTAGMKTKTEALRDSISTEFGPVAAGDAIQADLKGSFRNRVNATTRALNDQVEQQVGPGFYAYPENALGTSQAMSAINPAAPATSRALQNGRIAGIAGDLASDVLGTPMPGNSLLNEPTRYRRADGQVIDAPPGIPFGTLKNLRTSIGEEANSSAIMGTPEQGQFKRLYGAMSEDMRQAVNAADRQNAGVDVGPLQPSQQQGAAALNRANKFYSRASTRAEDLDGIANRSTPEGAYSAVAGSLNSGPSLYEKLRGTIDPKTRQKLVATIVDDLGTAKPGQQTADGEAWSPRTFLTEYSKLYQNGGGDALFKRLPGGQKHADQLADIAKAAEMVGDASKVWANPSGTSAANFARGSLGALGAGVLLAPFTAAKVGAGLLASNQVSKRLLLNPKFVNWLSAAPNVSANKMQASLQRLNANAKLWGDKQLQQDVADYTDAVRNDGAWQQ